MILARPVELTDPDAARAHVRRVGLGEESARWAARAVARPVTLILTGLPPGAARGLAEAGEGPESDGKGPLVLTGGGEAALISGSHWTLFSLATRLVDHEAPEVRAAAEALGRALSRRGKAVSTLPLGDGTLALGRKTRVMGVLNVTPDSFSDGGRWIDPEAAIAHGLAMVEAGADLIDVGGESTRPGADAVDAVEEARRVVPVIAGLAASGVRVSVDTCKAAVAKEALAAGAVMVNDVTGLGDPQMGPVVAHAGAALVVMHLRGTPRTMQSHTDYRDLLAEVLEGLCDSVARAEAAGVASDKVVIDPGIGFAKTPEQNLVLLRRLEAFSVLGKAMLVGTSRKSFIGHLTGAAPEARLPGTLASVVMAAERGAHLVRVHDVPETVQALAVADAIRWADAEGSAFDAGSGAWAPTDPRVG